MGHRERIIERSFQKVDDSERRLFVYFCEWRTNEDASLNKTSSERESGLGREVGSLAKGQ